VSIDDPERDVRYGSGRTALFGRGFRPLFLLAGLYGCAGLLVWLAVLAGWSAPRAWLAPAWWHGHEMIFGVVAAAIAGFLLTSVPVWTGATAVAGARLVLVVALWLAGRVAMLAAGALPASLVAALDLAFLPAVAALLAPALLRTGQVRNWGFVPILLVLLGCNAVMHAQALGLRSTGAAGALRLAADLVIVLIVVVGGRITPAFTRNALMRVGVEATVQLRPALDRLAIACVVAVGIVDLLLPRSSWSGAIALVAALSVAARMQGWQTLHTRHDPLLWSLHAGYAWVVAGLALVGIGDLTGAVPPTAGLHALTAGAMGSMMLAVMTRVSLGHTGRPLELPRGVVGVYVLVNLGALLRVSGPILLPALYLPTMLGSGALWAAAFGLFVIRYAGILLRPRVDGRPG
jgi:uncharacterized protein involved in response to NO